jgi:triacylglycerol esterase/lipase EstA (alpha/beta hydrolase family)
MTTRTTLLILAALLGAIRELPAQVSSLSPHSVPGDQPLTLGPAPAQDRDLSGASGSSDVAEPPPAPNFGGGCSTSPFAPPDTEMDDTVFVVDCGAGLDTGCTFRSGGPLTIQLQIKRYLGETNGDGTLAYPYTMNANKVVSLYAKLRLPAYDVDFTGSTEDCSPERDRISINGHSLGFLTGSNNIWKLNEFKIPIEYLKFSSAPGAYGSLPAAAMNEIKIDVDTGNSLECWCTAIDWVSVKIDAMAPIMLLHGVNANSSSWDDVAAYLNGKMIVHSNTIWPISNGAAGTIAANGNALSQWIPNIAKMVGAKTAHMVCHSKGGLDTRSYLGSFYDPTQVKVLSQHTLSTPHHGSILATISVARMTYNDPTSDDHAVETYMDQDALGSFLGQAPEQPALGNLAIDFMAAFNGANRLPGGVRYYAYGADADVDGDTLISNAEAAGLLPGALNFALNTGTLLYHVLCCVEGITVTRKTNLWGLNEWHVINPVWSGFFHLNDLAVTRESAMHPNYTWKALYDLNHGTIKSTGPTQDVLDQIQADFPVRQVPN